MTKYRLISVLVVVALVVMGALTAWQVAASAAYSSQAPAALSDIETGADLSNQDTVTRVATSGTPVDECFEVSLLEVAECRRADQLRQQQLPSSPE
jgi:hypothetical protein